MRTALLLFIIAFFVLFTTPFISGSIAKSQFDQNGIEAGWVKSYLERYTDTIYATGPVEEKTIKLRLVQGMMINAGFQVVHDESMGDEVVLKGAPAAIEQVSYSQFGEIIGFQFKKPVQMDRPLEIHINLNAHHLGFLELRMWPGQEQAFPPLVTKSEIIAHQLNISGCIATEGELLVKADVFRMSSDCGAVNQTIVKGTVRQLYTNAPASNQVYSSLAVENVNMGTQSPLGRNIKLQSDSLHIEYYFEGVNSQAGFDQLGFTPDTLRLKPGAAYSVHSTFASGALPDSVFVYPIYE